jgi:hypothetical protein
MQFHVPCGCGRYLEVSEGAAGATIACPCGRPVQVPGLKELRVKAGLPPYDISPELLVDDLLARREVPTGRRCAQCGQDTEDVLVIAVECERSWTPRRGPFAWIAVALLGLLAGVFYLLLLRKEEEAEPLGKDKIYHLPLTVCPHCRTHLRGEGAIKEALRTVLAYRKLLDKFPEARVNVEGVTKLDPEHG